MILVHFKTIGPIPAVRLSYVFRRFLRQFSTDYHEILQGLFTSHAATIFIVVQYFPIKILYNNKDRPSGM